MPPTVTFILGLCGSGKSYLKERMPEDVKFDEGFLTDVSQHAALLTALHADNDCVVVEIYYCVKFYRDQIISEVLAALPNVTIKWICFENDLPKANRNCCERTKADKNPPDPERHIQINQGLSPHYTYPVGSDIRPIWNKD